MRFIAVFFFALSGLLAAQAPAATSDLQIAAKVQKKLADKKSLNGIQVQAAGNDTVVLSGVVTDFHDVVEAEHIARQVGGVNGVVDHIQVKPSQTISDDKLQQEIAERLAYDRMYMGQTFNSLNVTVKNGVVTVGGQVIDYPDRDSALDIVEDSKGVRGVIDDIRVEPLSPMDDQIRMEAARRIYGNPELQRYAINPAHPIRIVVDNGHLTLTGVVQSQIDKTVAGNAVANIPGVFSIKNDLQVAH